MLGYITTNIHTVQSLWVPTNNVSLPAQICFQETFTRKTSAQYSLAILSPCTPPASEQSTVYIIYAIIYIPTLPAVYTSYPVYKEIVWKMYKFTKAYISLQYTTTCTSCTYDGSWELGNKKSF